MKKDREPMGEAPVKPQEKTTESRTVPLPPDAADVVPVPAAMSAAEIDERAKVVESLRDERDSRQREAPKGDAQVSDEGPLGRGRPATGDEMEEP